MRKHEAAATPPWTSRDSALWHTCEIAVDLAGGTVPQPRLQIAAAFPPQLGRDERFWAAGPFALLEERAAGDGTYLHNGGFFFATGPAGLTATAAAAAFRAAGNARRRRAAEQSVIPRWTQIEQGTLYVSPYGVHLQSPRALGAWGWSSITAASMVGPAAMHMFADSAQGQVSWILQSDWAELAFVTWALARHRRHPQLLTGAWLPPGWLQWCAGQAHPTRLKSPALIG